MKRHEPFVQRNMAVLEDRAHGDSELLAARAALPNALAVRDLAGLLWLACNRREFGGLTNKSTMRATCFAIGPALRFEKRSGTIFVMPRGKEHPHPGCFCKRVWNYLKTKELRFWSVQKSLEECEKKGDRTKHVGRFEGLNVGRLRKKEVSNSK